MGIHNCASLLDMITLLNGGSFTAVGNLSQLSDMLYRAVAEKEKEGVGLSSDIHDNMSKCLHEILRIANAVELDATIEMAITCLELFERAKPVGNGFYGISEADAERLSWSLNNLVRILSSQLHKKVVIVFDSKNSKYAMSDDPPYGEVVENAFPKAAEDILEAAKCLAFQRNTACVFHLMRAMESAVARLSEAIGTGKTTDKEWGKILADIEIAIKALPKGSLRDKWSESFTHLYHVKQAWRNTTMHPKTTYTDEQAQSVFDAVRSFMVHLAPLVA